jgi:methylmalonyl-CoA mutase N-terminal domain/subunit
MTINATAIVLLALYVAVAKRRQIPSATLSGTIQNDILGPRAAGHLSAARRCAS